MAEAAAPVGCSEAESEVVRGFLEAAIHTILHHRAVYPPELFELRRQYNVAVHMARPPALREYIASLLTAEELGHWLQQGLVERLVLAILAPDGTPTERFVFELGQLSPAEPALGDMEDLGSRGGGAAAAAACGRRDDSEALAVAAEGALRACLLRLNGSHASLLPNIEGQPLSFSVVMHMRGEGATLGARSPANPHATDAWVEAVGQERCEHGVGTPAGGSTPAAGGGASAAAAAAGSEGGHSCVLPMKDVALGPLSLRMYATEDPARKQQPRRPRPRPAS